MKYVIILLLLFSACSSGPQVPVATPVVNVACTWNVMDGGTCDNCLCSIDRSWAEAKPITTGNEIPNAQVTIDTHTSVEGTQEEQEEE